MRAKEAGRWLHKVVQMGLDDERPKRATVTSIANWNTTGEIEATLASGQTIYVHAPVVYNIAVDDVIFVTRQDMGTRARWTIHGMQKSVADGYVPTVRQLSGGGIDSILMDDSNVELMDDSGVYLTED